MTVGIEDAGAVEVTAMEIAGTGTAIAQLDRVPLIAIRAVTDGIGDQQKS